MKAVRASGRVHEHVGPQDKLTAESRGRGRRGMGPARRTLAPPGLLPPDHDRDVRQSKGGTSTASRSTATTARPRAVHDDFKGSADAGTSPRSVERLRVIAARPVHRTLEGEVLLLRGRARLRTRAALAEDWERLLAPEAALAQSSPRRQGRPARPALLDAAGEMHAAYPSGARPAASPGECVPRRPSRPGGTPTCRPRAARGPRGDRCVAQAVGSSARCRRPDLRHQLSRSTLRRAHRARLHVGDRRRGGATSSICRSKRCARTGAAPRAPRRAVSARTPTSRRTHDLGRDGPHGGRPLARLRPPEGEQGETIVSRPHRLPARPRARPTSRRSGAGSARLALPVADQPPRRPPSRPEATASRAPQPARAPPLFSASRPAGSSSALDARRSRYPGSGGRRRSTRAEGCARGRVGEDTKRRAPGDEGVRGGEPRKVVGRSRPAYSAGA